MKEMRTIRRMTKTPCYNKSSCHVLPQYWPISGQMDSGRSSGYAHSDRACASPFETPFWRLPILKRPTQKVSRRLPWPEQTSSHKIPQPGCTLLGLRAGQWIAVLGRGGWSFTRWSRVSTCVHGFLSWCGANPKVRRQKGSASML